MSRAVPQELPAAPHARPAREVAAALGTPPQGLAVAETAVRRARFGPNILPAKRPPGAIVVFLRQFRSPLIYVLLAAAVVSMLIGEHMDAGFIFAVLVLNALIGALQEYNAQRSASALQGLVRTTATVVRDGEGYEVPAADLVPGDLVLLESGGRVPADLRLLEAFDLRVDESLLTGESVPVAKQAEAVLESDTPLAERSNMAFAGTLVSWGRARGVVGATGLDTEVGKIARAVMTGPETRPPLLVRMERFTLRITLLMGGATVLMAGAALLQGATLVEIFLMAVALAVAAIPEGLPVALTVALAVGMRRMARRNVIVRELVAVESLGSCTHIASDKTGTLTVNELTVSRVCLPGDGVLDVTGSGLVPEGGVLPRAGADTDWKPRLDRLARAGVLCNEAFFGHRDGLWTGKGDAVDVALLVLGHKLGITRAELDVSWPLAGQIPFEPERRYAAVLRRGRAGELLCVKGAPEQVLPMCARMAGLRGSVPLDEAGVEADMKALAEQGYRVLAVAEGMPGVPPDTLLDPHHLRGLELLGLVGLIDPLRPEAREAVAACRDAGIAVSMITGDHPVTALSMARELGLAETPEQVVTGRDLREAERAGTEALDRLLQGTRVFARVEPDQKLDIVRAMIRRGHFVAVTGDGVNDAPALRAAHVGVAMGRAGTDVAREAAQLIVADDHFASIVAGVEEGRVAYGNVRKVVQLLISTGLGELVLFMLSLLFGLPLPLTAVQLLWLNLVTNGIQDVALAFEPAEGNELRRPPRRPGEPVFNRLMTERVAVSALVIGGVAFGLFHTLLAAGYGLEEARNLVLLLMVLFENVHVFNCRAEIRTAFRHSPMRNPLLLFGTLAAQGIHIAAMYTPPLQMVLEAQPVSFGQWAGLLGLALTLLAAVEGQKAILRVRRRARKAR